MRYSKAQEQQEIRSLIQNWDWETNPNYLEEMLKILIRIDDHNTVFKNDNLPPMDYLVKQKLVSLRADSHID